MPPDLAAITQKLAELEAKIDKVYTTSEKIRKYFMWTGIITVAFIVIPLIILPLFLPAFLSSVQIPTDLTGY